MSLPTSILQEEELANQLYEQMYGSQESSIAENQSVEKTSQEHALESSTKIEEAPQELVQPQINIQSQLLAKDNQINQMQQMIYSLQQQMQQFQSQSSYVSDTNYDNHDDSDDINNNDYSNDLESELDEEFGDELAKKLKKYVESKIEEKVEPVKQLSEQQLYQQKYNDFINQIRSAIPNFDLINDPNNPNGWHKWLGETDPFTNTQRQNLINQAVSNLDANWAITIINNFISQQNLQQQNNVATQQPTNAIKVTPLDQQIMPNAKTSSNNQTARRTWNEAQINDLYTRLRRDPNNPELIELERDIDKAYVEGRIVT